MEIEFLKSFKDHSSFQTLNDEDLKKFSLLIKPNKKNKYKKIKNNDNKKSLSNVKEKLQISKEKIESKFSLLINKLDFNNITKILEEFITKFKDINENDYNLFQKYIFTRILKDSKFQLLYMDFFMKIKNIYSSLFDFSDEYFILLVEYKFKYDYCGKKLNIIHDFNLDEIHELNSEENRINNINLILKFINNGLFNKNIIDELAIILFNSEYIPDIYNFINDKFIMNNYDFTKFYDILKFKVNNKMDNRCKVILNSILDKFGIEYKHINNRSDSITSIESDIDNEKLNYEITLKTVQSFEQYKSKIEIEIDNIIEEYLLIEDFEEIKNYLENNENVVNFMEELFNYYFKNNLNQFEKFKSLFLNFRNENYINSEIMINSLISSLNSDTVFDYLNIETKIKKLLEIFKILKINLDSDQKEAINKLII